MRSQVSTCKGFLKNHNSSLVAAAKNTKSFAWTEYATVDYKFLQTEYIRLRSYV